jgi:hypothetical protein
LASFGHRAAGQLGLLHPALSPSQVPLQFRGGIGHSAKLEAGIAGRILVGTGEIDRVRDGRRAIEAGPANYECLHGRPLWTATVRCDGDDRQECCT